MSKETIDALKQALEAISQVWRLAATGPEQLSKAGVEHLFEARSLLEQAISREEAQTVEPVYLVATGIVHNGQETYTRHDVCPPLCDAEKLFTHPTPTVKQPLPDECKAYIARLHELANHTASPQIERELNAVANMLAAGAQEIEHTRKMYEQAVQGRAYFRQALRDARSAQQVAVPQGYTIDRDWLYSVLRHANKNPDLFPDTEDTLDESDVETVIAIFAAPQPPQAERVPTSLRPPRTAQEFKFGMNVLDWNRAQQDPPIDIGRELWVADEVAKFFATQAQPAADLTDDAFDALCREHGIYGTAEARLCRVFWLAAQKGKP